LLHTLTTAQASGTQPDPASEFCSTDTDPLTATGFVQTVLAGTASRLNDLESCPLQEAWEELARDDHDKTVICAIAGEIDKWTLESVVLQFCRIPGVPDAPAAVI
jgi:hypothetical protein